MIEVVTSCSAKGYAQYGRRCVESFLKYWSDATLYVVSEDTLDVPAPAVFMPLALHEAGVRFLAKHAHNLTAQGRVNFAGSTGWTPRKLAQGYNFRYDAFRFSKKLFAIELVARQSPDGPLIWLDADVVTFASPPPGALAQLLPSGLALSCLDRGSYHSECGFVGYNLAHPKTRGFIADLTQLYTKEQVFKLEQWHDSWVFDWLRRKNNIPTHAIPHKSRSHPFVNSELGRFMDHAKGNRKSAAGGRTSCGELVVNRDLPYWGGR